MRKAWFLTLVCGAAFAQAPPTPSYNCEPVNPNATPEARALLKKLCAISGMDILAGQHNSPNQRSQDSDRVAGLAGKYPAVWGSDFGFTDGEDKDAWKAAMANPYVLGRGDPLPTQDQ